jgi:PAS domain S-box-containing protein
MTTQLEHELARLHRGDHVCPIHESVAEQMAVAVPFIVKGLGRGERSLYIADDANLRRISDAFVAAKVDAEGERRRGTLHLLSRQDTYLRSGKFHPQAMIDFLHEAEAAALADGFSGLRCVGAMTWVMGTDVDSDLLVEYEAMLNCYVEQSQSVILCQYDRTRFDAALIHDILRVHPVAILGEIVCPNPYYEPPDLIGRKEQMEKDEYKRKRVGWWITRLKAVTEIEQERVRAEEALVESERKFRTLFDVADAGIFLMHEGRVVDCNPAALKMFGLPIDQLVGLAPGEFSPPTQPDGRSSKEKSLEKMQNALTGEPQFFEWVLRRPDGTLIDCEVSLKSFKLSGKTYLHAIARDITDKKQIEAQLLRAQRMESIGTLAGGIAHDLNNILAPIMMAVDILKLSTTDPQGKRILETIEVSSKRGSDIVRQVLSFARGLEGERVKVELKSLLKDIRTIIEETFPKNIRLEVSVPEEPWAILGDPTQLHQILLNLSVNARDAMPEGGRLSITVENTVLDEQYATMHAQARAGRYVILSVTDSGTGIPPALLEKIFDPFFTTKEVGKGTGLGLSTVMAIVKSHRGFVNVYSEPDKGTAFKVFLPAVDASSDGNKDLTLQGSAPHGSGETILVVDDEASILTITSQTLEAFGYRTLTAGDGAEAVAVYAQHRDEIAVVLTDMAMPIMDGPATIRALRKINPAVKVVAASGLNSERSAAKAADAGSKHLLTKPFTAETLLKTLRDVLDEK